VQDLIRLLPDGASAVAVIVVVMLFLKQQDKLNLTLKAVTTEFHDQENESRKTYQEQFLKLTSQQYEKQKLYHDQIQSLIDAHINVARETVLAIKALEMSLKEARDRGRLL
jgi:hypothetical protein